MRRVAAEVPLRCTPSTQTTRPRAESPESSESVRSDNSPFAVCGTTGHPAGSTTDDFDVLMMFELNRTPDQSSSENCDRLKIAHRSVSRNASSATSERYSPKPA